MKALLLLLLLAALPACAAPPAPGQGGRYPDEAKSTRTVVTVRVVWLPSFDATTQVCSALVNWPPPPKGTIAGCYDPSTATIYAVEPKNFNDYVRLEILGHEFWHALGAEHPVVVFR